MKIDLAFSQFPISHTSYSLISFYLRLSIFFIVHIRSILDFQIASDFELVLFM